MSGIDKPSQNEEEYFAKRDRELLEQQRKAMQEAATTAERRSHFMRCPKCGAQLDTVGYGQVQIDKCPECLGVWLDAGELELLHRAEGSGGLLGSVVRDMRDLLGAKGKGGA